MSDLPIGIFDSGIGGITVTKEILNLLPNENIIYLGDTARVPYGSRSRNDIITYSLQLADYLIKRQVKMLVIACNTISTVALEEVKRISPVPIVEVTNPTVEEAIRVTANNKIGIIGTDATIESKIYEDRLHEKGISTHALSCPLFVPIIESGSIDEESTKEVVSRYLVSFNELGIDTLILGCTHYPLLIDQIKHTLNQDINIVDSAKPTAHAVVHELNRLDLRNKGSMSIREFLVTGNESQAYATLKHLIPDIHVSKLSKIAIPETNVVNAII